MTQFYYIKDEKVYAGELVEDDNFITVHAGNGSKSSQLNGMDPESLANMLLRTLIKEGHVAPIQSIPVVIKDGLRVFRVTETNINGSVIITFLVAGQFGVLGIFDSLGEAESYLEELLSEDDEPEPPKPKSSMGY